MSSREAERRPAASRGWRAAPAGDEECDPGDKPYPPAKQPHHARARRIPRFRRRPAAGRRSGGRGRNRRVWSCRPPLHRRIGGGASAEPGIKVAKSRQVVAHAEASSETARPGGQCRRRSGSVTRPARVTASAAGRPPARISRCRRRRWPRRGPRRGRYHREAVGETFEHRHRQTLVVRRQHEQVGPRTAPGSRLPPSSPASHPFGEAERRRLGR